MATSTAASMASWRQVLEADAAELARSERVTNQLRAVLQSMQKKADDLDAERRQLEAKALADDRLKGIEGDVTSAREAVEVLEARQAELSAALQKERCRLEASLAAKDAALEERAHCESAEAKASEATAQAEQRCEEATSEARSLVSADALLRTEAEANEMRERLRAQESETSKLRQALADSWAARVDEDLGEAAPRSSSDDAEALQRMEEELNWLGKMQRDAAIENRHLQKLERSELALQAQLREVSEEKAALQSARVDLGDAGRAMREAIAHQSEGYIRRLGDLEGARRTTDEDRMKLLDECAELQARLDAMRPQLDGLSELEGRHGQLEAEKQALVNEAARLRTVNAALGAQLLGDDAPPPMMSGGDEGSAGAVAEAINRVLQLQMRLIERVEAHAAERDKLAERIRQLEREASQPDEVAPTRSLRELQGSRPAPEATSGPLAAATSVFKGGLGKLREAGLPLR